MGAEPFPMNPLIGSGFPPPPPPPEKSNPLSPPNSLKSLGLPSSPSSTNVSPSHVAHRPLNLLLHLQLFFVGLLALAALLVYRIVAAPVMFSLDPKYRPPLPSSPQKWQ